MANLNPVKTQRILDLAKERGALQFGEFKLSAGGTSSYYFDGRIITLDPEVGYYVAKVLIPILKDCKAQAIAGPTLGADPIVSAVSVLSHIEGNPLPGLIIRKETKGYGGKRNIEGPIGRIGKSARIAVVDDACTTASSLFHAINVVESAGHEVVKVIAILDRNEGGSEKLRSCGYDFVALLSANQKGEIIPRI